MVPASVGSIPTVAMGRTMDNEEAKRALEATIAQLEAAIGIIDRIPDYDDPEIGFAKIGLHLVLSGEEVVHVHNWCVDGIEASRESSEAGTPLGDAIGEMSSLEASDLDDLFDHEHHN